MSFIKDLKDYTKGCNLKCKLLHTKLHLRWAFQRFWTGYDERDVMDFGYSLNKRIAMLLEQFLKTSNFTLKIPQEITKNSEIILYYTEDQTQTILNTVIEYFKMADEDYVLECYYNKKDVYVLNCEDYKRLESIRKQNQDLAYEHLRMFLDDIWY